MYDFTKGADRSHDGSFKYCAAPMKDDPAIIPMWVADMDFPTLPEVVQAIENRAACGVFGYTPATEEFLNAAVRWMDARHGLKIEKDWIIPVPGIVPGIKVLIQALTEPGDEIMIFTPVYHPFKKSIEINQRKCVEFSLDEKEDTYEIDFEKLEQTLQDHSVKMMIFCSPHNPIGKVWDEADLVRLGALCEKHGIEMISDEIHMDFARMKKHVPFLRACEELAMQTVLAAAPTKTFNLAGLQVSILIAPNPEYRRKIHDVMERNGMETPSVLAMEAAAAAWNHGNAWVDELNKAIENNIAIVEQWIETSMPQLRLFRPEGLYLLWLDCRKLGLSAEELEAFMTNEAKVFFNQGIMFGSEGDGFVRMNVGCPPETVKKALAQIESAWKARQ